MLLTRSRWRLAALAMVAATLAVGVGSVAPIKTALSRGHEFGYAASSRAPEQPVQTASEPGAVSSFGGIVCVDANCAIASSQLVARVDGVECGTTLTVIVVDGVGSMYHVDVASTADVAGCGTEGAPVEFYVGGRLATPKGEWKAGTSQTLDIWAGEDFAAYSGELLMDGEPWPWPPPPHPPYVDPQDPLGRPVVRAFIGSAECGKKAVQSPAFAAYTLLVVQPASLSPGCGQVESRITFTVNGVTVKSAAAWEPGFHSLDLDVPFTFPVNSTADTVDQEPGDSICADVTGMCTLRAAVMEANARTGPEEISVPPGSYQPQAAAADWLDIFGDVTIRGAGADSTVIDGNDLVSIVIGMRDGTGLLADLTVRGGFGGFNNSGGIVNAGNLSLERVVVKDNSGHLGAGISNRGSLTVSDSTIADNHSEQAAGIGNAGILKVTDSTFTDNESLGNAQGIGNYFLGTADIINSTFSDNRGPGSAIRNFGTLTLTNVTIAGNGWRIAAGGVHNGGGVVNLRSTILSGNDGGNCSGTFNSLGWNLDSDGTCGLTTASDQTGVDPRLGPLVDNDGPTQTRTLLPDSPAIDAGDNANCPETDQRGYGRPVDGDNNGSVVCDIGAYEAGGSLVTPTPTPTPSPTPTPAPTLGPHKLGDVNCAGGLDSVDALFILRYVANLTSYGSCIGIGDVNCDSRVDAVDALGVLRFVAGLPPLPAPAFCATLSQAVSIETAQQMGAGWDVACSEWEHQLSDVVGSFDNVNHHRVAVYCRGSTPSDRAERVVIYELQDDRLAPLLTFDEPIGTFPTHFDLASWGENPLPAFRDLVHNGLNELAVRQFAGGNCWECFRLRIFAVQDHQARQVPLILPATGLLGEDDNHDGTSAVPMDLSDIDGDGVAELIAADTAWELHGFCHACSPSAVFVLAWNGHEYANASPEPRFRSYFDSRITAQEELLAQGANDEGRMSFAIGIALYYGRSGRADVGWQRFHAIAAGLQSQCWKDALPDYEHDLALSVPEDGTIPQTSVPGEAIPSCPAAAQALRPRPG